MPNCQNTNVCWGGRIRTSDWLIQNQLIAAASRDLEFRRALARLGRERIGGQAR